MSRIFAYCRVSTAEQSTDGQILAIRTAGYAIDDHRVVSERISGGVNATERPVFKAMLEHSLEAGDVLVVLKLDRLGRDNIDVQSTISLLQSRFIKVVSLDLPTDDLTSSNGRLIMQMFAVFAEFEKNRIRERTMEGLAKAKDKGVRLGRPKFDQHEELLKLKAMGRSQSYIARALGVSVSTVKRSWNKVLVS